jgi:hypothetical protein
MHGRPNMLGAMISPMIVRRLTMAGRRWRRFLFLAGNHRPPALQAAWRHQDRLERQRVRGAARRFRYIIETRGKQFERDDAI